MDREGDTEGTEPVLNVQIVSVYFVENDVCVAIWSLGLLNL